MHYRSSSSFDYNASRICKTCSSKFSGRYCNQCGEKVLEPEDKSIFHFLGSIINAFTFADNKLLTTLGLMVTRPGSVTKSYIDGIRMPFIKPVSMFFLVNLIYFLFPAADTFNSSLDTQMRGLPYSNFASAYVQRHLEAENKTLETFATEYNQQSTSMAKLLLIVFVVMLAVPIGLLNYSKRWFFADHLSASLEFNSVAILIALVFVPWLTILVDSLFSADTHAVYRAVLSDARYSILVAAFSAFLFFSFQRRVYEQRVWSSLIKAPLLVFCLYYILQAYRALLFFATMWTI